MPNPLLMTDVYKLGHMIQYAPGTTSIYSYLENRKTSTVFFGLKYLIETYVKQPITLDNFIELKEVYEVILGPMPPEVERKFLALVELGYWPVTIKAVPEGKEYPVHTPLLTIENNKEGFHWCVGYLETLLLKLWYPCNVSSIAKQYYDLAEKYYGKDSPELPYAVHNFGSRGCTTEEADALSGAAHLLFFKGSDSLQGHALGQRYYLDLCNKAASVPATEHSIMMSYLIKGTVEEEIACLEHLLTKVYPTGIVSIVADTIDYGRYLGEVIPACKSTIFAREGKFVVRGDSGVPSEVLFNTVRNLWYLGDDRMLNKPYKLHPKLGCIYGEGLHLAEYEKALKLLRDDNYAASCIVIGVGGIMTQSHNRDTAGFALKAASAVINGEERPLQKFVKTDAQKVSLPGRFIIKENGAVYTGLTRREEAVFTDNILQTVYEGIPFNKANRAV